MKKLLIITLCLFFYSGISAQLSKDSLIKIINLDRKDVAEINALIHLANLLTPSDSATTFINKALSLSENLGYKKGKADCFLILANQVAFTSNFGQAIQYDLAALTLYEEIRNNVGIATSHLALQGLYRSVGDYKNSLTHAFACLHIAEANNLKGEYFLADLSFVPAMLAEIGQSYVLMNQLDSALYFTQKAIQKKEKVYDSEWNFPVYLLATIQNMQGNYDIALLNYRKALPLAVKNKYFWDTLQIFSGMASLFNKTGQTDSAINFAKMVAVSSDPKMELKNLLEALTNLAEAYKINGNKDSAIKYLELSFALKDSIFSNEKNRQIQAIAFNENLKRHQLEADQLKYKNNVQKYTLAGGILILLLIAAILWRNNRHKQLAKLKIEMAYAELKSTQVQLIQSEKMASLGELTAGIAHEIQNPLNFVNNFSEVNKELVDELQIELKSGNIDEAMAISNNIKDNEEKISRHGKRADAIVKGMLQHSHGSIGVKELTDINALSDEYLRLAYQGLRAKDKNFNATLKTDFDAAIGKINIIPQDIGRVLLNLINNAFYAVNEKSKEAVNGYDPVVTVSTRMLPASENSLIQQSPSFGVRGANSIIISVKDNGNGISQKILDKIFQPFFTTKPTGQGTGLGLSLSYDIVKAHGGDLRVETKEGVGSVFIIQLPSRIEGI
jgi:signal transduction histidine kinase